MAQCIVCKADYTPNQAQSICPRCGISNQAWDEWRAHDVTHLVEYALLPMMFPLLLLLAASFAAIILMRASESLYADGVGSFFLIATIFFSLLAIGGVVFERYRLRERILLQGAGGRAAGRLHMGISPLTTIVFAMVFSFVIATVFAFGLPLTTFLADRTTASIPPTVLAPPPTVSAGDVAAAETAAARVTVISVFTPSPIVAPTAVPQSIVISTPGQRPLQIFLRRLQSTMRFYVGFLYLGIVVACVYIAALWALSWYLGELNARVPSPIFLQPHLQLTVIQQEVADHLGVEAASMTWQDFERTEDGGTRLTVRQRYDSKRVEDLVGRTTQLPMFRKYKIEADRWGRLGKIEASQETDA
jgi:hypothetical protein